MHLGKMPLKQMDSHFIWTQQLREKRGTSAKHAWGLGNFQRLETVLGDLTEFDRIVP